MASLFRKKIKIYNLICIIVRLLTLYTKECSAIKILEKTFKVHNNEIARN